jgi:hypothetical protein
MRRILASSAVLAGALVLASSASAGIHGGFNKPSNRLEIAFKIALFERAADPNGCYPAPTMLAADVRRKTKNRVKTAVTAGDGGVSRFGVVYVIRHGTNCDHIRLGYRASEGLYILDSDHGPVEPPGARKKNRRGSIRRLTGLTIASASSRLTGANQTKRLTVSCPRGTSSLGGGFTGSPPAGPPDGEGVYPHSFERLGVQRGYHVSTTMIDPTPSSTTPRQATVQAVCAHGLVPATPSPHRTVFVRPGQTRTVTASCPAGQFLFSGGFQRTDFRNPRLPDGGGDYITESRAVGPKTWQVTASAYGRFGGELTAVALCVGHGGPLLTEVSASTPVASGQSGTATTPTCPAGRQLVAGGFSENGSIQGFVSDGFVNRNGTWSASAYGFFGAVPTFTAYGYCLQA